MANKLPWFKHDHDARHDDFIYRAEERFGHFGYAAYFKLLEILHTHGVGDKLLITRTRLTSELRSKWPPVRMFLDYCQDAGKISWSDSGPNVGIEVKNFRKKQDKKKFKTDSNGPMQGLKTALDVDVEEEGDKDKLGFLDTIKRLAGGFRVTPWTAAELEGHQFPFGKEKGRKVIDMEPSRCQFYLDRIQMDAKTTAALKHRIKLKAAESIR